MEVNDNTIELEIIRKLQVTQYYILKEFEAFCKLHNLVYTLDFGTMLGAVRHQGFIPWDDDIDVSMLRSEYNRFLELSKSWIHRDIFVQNYETDPQFIHSFTRLRLNDSLALQEDWKNLKCHHGIFIDIFVYDVVAGDEEACQRHADEIRIIQEEKMKYVRSDTVNDQNLLVLNRLQTAVTTRYNDTITKDSTIAHMTLGLDSYYPMRRSVSDFDNIQYVSFEDDLYPIPSNYDAVLTYNYGDYMTLPNEEEQRPHHAVIRIKFREDIL